MSANPRVSIHLLVLLVICYFLFFFRMGARDLWSPDEPRYAQVAREMLETGEYVVPHLNGQVYTEKPPLYFWLVAFVSRAFGNVSEATARFPSAVAATLVVLLTYFLGTKMLRRREAFWGSLVLATSAQFFSVGREGVIDPLLTLCILASLATFYIGYIGKHDLLYTAGFLFLAPAALSKGPVGIAIPVIVMLTFLPVEILLGKDGSGKQVAWFALGAFLGLMVVAFLVVPWWKAAYEKSGGVYGSLSILAKQTHGRILHSYSHRRPFYYYFKEILWQFLPWTVFFPLAAHTLKKNGDLGKNPGMRFLVVWFLSVFLFFTCISGKRSQYLMPLMPAGGLLLGWAIGNSDPGRGRLRERREFSIPIFFLVTVCLVGLAAVPVGTYLYFREHFGGVSIGTIFALIALLILYRKSLDRPPTAALISLSIVTALMVAALFGFAGPAIDEYKSARPFCNTVLAAMRDRDEIFFYGFYRPNIQYYMHRSIPVLEKEEEVIKALSESDRIFLILQWKQKDTLAIEAPYMMEHVIRSKIGSRDVLCVVAHRAKDPALGGVAPAVPSLKK